MGHEFKRMISEDYGIEQKPIMGRSLQANAIIERVHQTIGNMIHTFNLEENFLDGNDPWSGILSATAFAVRSTYHTTLRATPGQLVFGRDMILNIQHIANWKAIQDHKQMIINKNNEHENAKCTINILSTISTEKISNTKHFLNLTNILFVTKKIF